MKKILIILLAILCIPISSYAISLSTLENNPNRYLKVAEDSEAAEYIDICSIKSIRYSPPYYTLSAKLYFAKFADNRIYDYYEVFNYDYTYSPESTRKRVISDMNQSYEPLDEDVIASRVNEALLQNSGIFSNIEALSCWTLDGHLKAKFPPGSQTWERTLAYNTRGYDKANAVFQTYYKQDF